VTWEADLERASDAWRHWCAAVEGAGLRALADTITRDEIDLAEGVRHLTRMVRLTLGTGVENVDASRPYLWRALGPDLKMGGDNPNGLYLSAPINGTDTYRVRGTRGSARWVSFLSQRRPECLAEGLAVFGDAVFGPDLRVAADGTFELVLAPEPHEGNWIRTDPYSATFLVRQFFGTSDDVRPMDLTIENESTGDEPPAPLTLDDALARLELAAARMALLLPAMQGELIAKGATKNAFATDVGDPTSNFGGVPGGNAVTSRWRLEPHEALLVQVTPPSPCAYWDVQVGNGWYESWDYRSRFSGLTCEQAHLHDDGSVTIVVAEQDPGTANWLETAGHREGHLAIRWQLTEGTLPIPACTVVDVVDVVARTGLPAVGPEERGRQRRALRAAFDARFRP
jgi:hypothetical protein